MLLVSCLKMTDIIDFIADIQSVIIEGHRDGKHSDGFLDHFFSYWAMHEEELISTFPGTLKSAQKVYRGLTAWLRTNIDEIEFFSKEELNAWVYSKRTLIKIQLIIKKGIS
jgi:hypothetical protein